MVVYGLEYRGASWAAKFWFAYYSVHLSLEEAWIVSKLFLGESALENSKEYLAREVLHFYWIFKVSCSETT